MSDLSKQDIALMNAEMAARIFMHIAQDKANPAETPAKSLHLTDEEQQALRDMFGGSDPGAEPNTSTPSS